MQQNTLVLTRIPQLTPSSDLPLGDEVLLGVVLDTETTGRDPSSDKVVEIGLIQFAYCKKTMRLLGTTQEYSGLEDPGVPMPADATKINGITDEMLAGQKFDDAQILAILESSDFVIAHNAAFDRGFMEERFPSLPTMPWLCSLKDIDWAEEGIHSGRLDYIAFRMGYFYDAHRAISDCNALLYILCQLLPESLDTGLNRLLNLALESKTHRIWSGATPYAWKDTLKSLGFRWSDGSAPGMQKSWYIDVDSSRVPAILEQMREAFFGTHPAYVQVQVFGASARHSRKVIPPLSSVSVP